MAENDNASDDDSPGGMNIKIHPLSTAVNTVSELTKTLDTASSVFMKVGMGGFLVISGSIIGAFTIILSFLTGTGDKDRWYGGITYEEEFTFIFFSILLCILGVIFSTKQNEQNAKIKEKGLELESERNRLLSEENIKKIEVLGPQLLPETADMKGVKSAKPTSS